MVGQIWPVVCSLLILVDKKRTKKGRGLFQAEETECFRKKRAVIQLRM